MNNNNNNNESNNDWCHYSNMPSPMAYMNDANNIMKQEHTTFNDSRGSYTPIQTNELGIEWNQCSLSVNDKKGTFRGLHYQTNPAQTKYVKVIRGSIIDFMLDLDTNELHHCTLDSNEAILVPHNMAHGFLTLEDMTIVAYMVKGEYNPHSEHSIVWHTIEGVKRVVLDTLKHWNHTEIKIYTEDNLIISDKDNLGK